MHAAPAVRVSLGRSIGWAVFVGVCTALATGNAVAWALLQSHRPGVLVAALVSAALAGTAAALVAWRTQPVGELIWDGSQWQGGGVAGPARVLLDLGPWMLVRLPGRWFALSRRSTAGPWAALRAALHAPVPATR